MKNIILFSVTLLTSAVLAFGQTTLTAGSCSGCDAQVTVTFDGCDNCVDVTSCKDLSNVVLVDCQGTHYKFDNLNQGQSGTFCHPSGYPVATVYVKSGCFQSGDGPGYGHRIDGPCTSGGSTIPPSSVSGGTCSGCDASMTVDFNGCDSCVTVSSCKDLSNVVLLLCDGTEYKFDNLNQGQTGTFCSPDGQNIVAVWVKSGCFLSGDGPGYGRRIDGPCGLGVCDNNVCAPVGNAGPSAPVTSRNDVNTVRTIVSVIPGSSNRFSFLLESEGEKEVRLEILDMSGTPIETVYNGGIAAGSEQVATPSKTYENGIYIYRLTTESGVKVGKIMVRE